MIDEIKAKLDLVELIGEQVKLQRVGAQFRGLCPFHHDRNPSFYVTPERQFWICFGCGRKGDLINFVMEREGLEFKDALKLLAERAGVEWREGGSAKERNLILELNRVATKFFKDQLTQTAHARDYLLNRGLTEQTLNHFDIGYAPLQNELRDYLFSLGYELKDCVAAGLLSYHRDDRFRGRIMFPLLDHTGKGVGFTGRIFPDQDDTAKYLNTPETEAYRKSHLLYGLSYAAPAIKERGEVIVVEGQMDFLLAWQHGLKNVVAISGTAFTEDQLRLLKRYAKRLTFALDEDEAGLKATLKSTPLALALGFEVRKLIFPTGKDLGEFLPTGKIETLEMVPLLDYLFGYAQQHYDLTTPEGKRKLLDLILPQLKALDAVRVQAGLTKLAAATRIREDLLMAELAKTPTPAVSARASASGAVAPRSPAVFTDKYGTIGDHFIAAAVALGREELFDGLTDELANWRELIEKLRSNQSDDEVELIRLRAHHEREHHPKLEEELTFLICELRKEHLRRKIELLRAELEQGEGEVDRLTEVRRYTEALKALEQETINA